MFVKSNGSVNMDNTNDVCLIDGIISECNLNGYVFILLLYYKLLFKL